MPRALGLGESGITNCSHKSGSHGQESMRPGQRRATEKRELTGPRLEEIIDPTHSLVRLASAIDWRLLGHSFSVLCPIGPTHLRLITGLSVLKRLHDLSEDAVCDRWLENPYYQHFCGGTVFQHHLPIDPLPALRELDRMAPDKFRAMFRAAFTASRAVDMPELAGLGIVAGSVAQRTGSDEKSPQRPLRAQSNESQKPVSIYDVARHAGVSIKTVSLVINRQPNVSAHTRTVVLSAIDALSYRPNVFARGLASERSFLIGMLYDTPPGSYIADLQLGALARCRREGYHLIVELLNPHEGDVTQRVRSLVSESVLHGVILTPPLCDAPAVIEELLRAQTPFVRIAPGTHIPGSPSISIDEYKAAHEMTAYLIALGHRRIGFIKGKPDHGASLARLEGYRAALAEAGLPFAEELCAQGFFTYQSGLEAGEYLLSLKSRPTAIFAGNDDMAAGVLAVSQRFNLKIPEELSLAGFDDSLVANVVWPRLTTCRQPVKEMAEAAVSILIEKRDRTAPLERHLEHELVVRESTAPPAA
jgi:LacI family transcriptional regulator, galactose operon repressor